MALFGSTLIWAVPRGPLPKRVPMSDNSKSDIPLQMPERIRAATKRLADQQANVKAQAERLNACIERFEAWVAEMPGRVETSIAIPDPPPSHEDGAPEYALYVRIARDGKRWPVAIG